MPSKFMFCCLELNRSREIPFQKSIVYRNVLLDNLGQRYKFFLPRKNAERRKVEL